MAKRKDREAIILFPGDRLGAMEQFCQLAQKQPDAGVTDGRHSIAVNYAPEHSGLLDFLSANCVKKEKKEPYEMDSSRGVCSVTVRSTDLQRMLGEGDPGLVYQLKRSLSSSDARVNEIVGHQLLYATEYPQSASRFLERIQNGDFPEPQGNDVDLKTLGVTLDGCATKAYVLLAVGLASLLLYAGYQLTRKGAGAVKLNNDRFEQFMNDYPAPAAPPAPIPPSARATPRGETHSEGVQKKEEKKTPDETPHPPAKGASR